MRTLISSELKKTRTLWLLYFQFITSESYEVEVEDFCQIQKSNSVTYTTPVYCKNIIAAPDIKLLKWLAET